MLCDFNNKGFQRCGICSPRERTRESGPTSKWDFISNSKSNRTISHILVILSILEYSCVQLFLIALLFRWIFLGLPQFGYACWCILQPECTVSYPRFQLLASNSQTNNSNDSLDPLRVPLHKFTTHFRHIIVINDKIAKV